MMKKSRLLLIFLPIMLMICMLIQSMVFTAGAASSEDWLMGDVDGDGHVTIIDATTIQKILASLIVADEGMISRGKVHGDQTLSILDAATIQKYLSQLPFNGRINAPVEAVHKKKVSILGASISTFEGTIPERYSPYYPHETNNSNPVSDISDMYWQQFIDTINGELLINNSSAGSFCSTGHGYDNLAGCSDRCEALDNGVDTPDIIVIQLGGNDFTRSTPIGSYNGTQDFPTQTDTFREAYAVMLRKITEKYPNAVIICGTITMIRSGAYVTNDYPPRNKPYNGNPGGIELEEYNNAIREIAGLFGCRVAEFARCGITFDNIPLYMQDGIQNGNRIYGQHPNRAGHTLMANELLRAFQTMSVS